MNQPYAISQATPEDLPAVLALNEAFLPHVSSLTPEALRELAAQSCYFRVARREGKVAGFLLAIGPGQSYQSLNYRWFCEHYDNFIYVDRIAVAEEFHGLGVGRALYEDVERTAARNAPYLTCEVNLLPPNPGSLAFHHKLGFEEVGQQDTDGGKKRVSLLARRLEPGAA